MLPFPVTLIPGESPARQVVYAATRAVVAGIMPPGTAFPSVRELSQALRINPNTAHKVVQELVRTGVLQVLPGVGTVVSTPSASVAAGSPAERQALLTTQVEQLVVEARRLGVTERELEVAVATVWTALQRGEVPPSTTIATSDDI